MIYTMLLIKLNLLDTKEMCNSSKTDCDFKPLPKQFHGMGEVKGYLFTQIRQTNKAFIYEVSSGDSKYYEVFLRKENRRFACVSYPSSKAFGIWA